MVAQIHIAKVHNDLWDVSILHFDKKNGHDTHKAVSYLRMRELVDKALSGSK